MYFFKTLVILTLIPQMTFAESSFVDVQGVLKSDSPPIANKAAEQELGIYLSHELPQYPVNMSSIFGGGSDQLTQDGVRTINDGSDYYDRLPKLIHPNGVCISGVWKMDSTSPYSGAFSANTNHLFVGRISVAMEKTNYSSRRGFGFAGKLFPTMDPQKPVSTENFFSVDVLMGTKNKFFLDTAMTNEPETGFDFWVIRLGLKIAKALTAADENPGYRPLNNLARLNAGKNIKTPHWIRISAGDGILTNSQTDFRNEVLQAVAENETLTFDVHVSDTTKKASDINSWLKIGQIEVNDAMVSYGCDRRLHFAHPRLSED